MLVYKSSGDFVLGVTSVRRRLLEFTALPRKRFAHHDQYCALPLSTWDLAVLERQVMPLRKLPESTPPVLC